MLHRIVLAIIMLLAVFVYNALGGVLAAQTLGGATGSLHEASPAGTLLLPTNPGNRPQRSWLPPTLPPPPLVSSTSSPLASCRGQQVPEQSMPLAQLASGFEHATAHGAALMDAPQVMVSGIRDAFLNACGRMAGISPEVADPPG